MNGQTIKKALAWLLLMALLCTPLLALATQTALPAVQGQLPKVLRILLTRPGITTQADLELDGVYTADIGGVTMLFPYASKIVVLLIDDQLYIDYAGMRLGTGTELVLTRYQNDAGGENGFRFYDNPSLYEGDVTLRIQDGMIRMILSIAVEDYLKGVVPYEMSDSFPLEALKAQAVAARTYAVRKALNNPNGEYQLTDTTNDQVFKGTRDENKRSQQAIAETAGVCAFYNDKLVMCYYGSSNGGQTELVENQWGPGDETGYLDMRDDPYDVENPKSVVKSAYLLKTPFTVEDTPYGLRALIAQALFSDLTAKGYDPAAESVRIDSISAVSVDTPKFAAPSRLYTQFHITFTYSGRTRTDYTPPPGQVLKNDIEISLFTATPAPDATATPVPTDTPEPTATPEPTPTPAPVYGAFEPVEGEITLDIPIFRDAENALGLSINQYDNELWTVEETGDAFVVESRRFGHGVGMSQYGAEWMAAQYGMAYTEILSFYYPGITLMRYTETAAALPHISSAFTKAADPPPTPTPRPTLMPVTTVAGEGQWYVRVTNIGENSWLNLRSDPSLSSDILMLLFKDQRLLVLERMPQEGWLHVKTDVTEGYVMEEFTTPE
ncbi:MAG TPA: SpoIID/LytB domain-containing protein [Candidatus Limiplasma sp.]|nr:SpoIID/LytB domain-containing protein [Candidatus Limiplasma sp.]HRX08807.1 SpoIID/LytB domain-containing protein [Candidatus Limiplasma sp.]